MFPAWNPLDPLGSLNEMILNALKAMNQLYERIISGPPRISNNESLLSRYQDALNTGNYLAYMVLVFVTAIALALFRKGSRIPKAFLVSFILAAITPSFLYFIDTLTVTGDQWTAAVTSMFDDTKTVDAPSFSNVILDIPAAIFTMFFGGVLTAYIVSYDIIIIIAKMLLPITYALSPLGKRAMQALNIVISLMLVATLLGRPLAALIIELGQFARATLPFGNTAFGATVYMILAYLLAGLSQITLTVALYHAAKAVEGKISSMVSGAVKTTVSNVATVNVRKSRENHSAGIQPVVPVPVPMGRGVMRDARTMATTAAKSDASRAALRGAIKVGSKAGAAAAAAVGQPKAAMVINRYGGKFAKRFR